MSPLSFYFQPLPMPRAGTLVICVQNLDYSGANQVVLNIVTGGIHDGNVLVLSPVIGLFAARFIDSGAAVRVGNIADLLRDVGDAFCVLCNTIMTANIVVALASSPFPVVWILHEWWDDKMIVENLAIRKLKGLDLFTIKSALQKASMIVFVCEAQKSLYNPLAPSSVIYVGVPGPLSPSDRNVESNIHTKANCTTFLCLGIVCPRKNQVWAIQTFKAFAGTRKDVRLLVVGARYTREYEAQYVSKVKAAMGADPRIELFDVTDNVNQFYDAADCLLFTSINEVTPMVISEAMSWGLPVISTNIAGIPEMVTDGVEGYLFRPGDRVRALDCMQKIAADPALRRRLGEGGKRRHAKQFDIECMVEQYRQLLLDVAPPTILVDMDNTLVDWDAGFLREWGGRSEVVRERSYFMQKCVPAEFRDEAQALIDRKGFFLTLPPAPDGLLAMRAMEEAGLRVRVCTSPLLSSRHCAQEKLEWVRLHLGEGWVKKVIMCHEKAMVRGDVLIDDRPMGPAGHHSSATWKQVMFDAPYNRTEAVGGAAEGGNQWAATHDLEQGQELKMADSQGGDGAEETIALSRAFVGSSLDPGPPMPRLRSWKDWRSVIFPLLGKSAISTQIAGLPSLSTTNVPLLLPSASTHDEQKGVGAVDPDRAALASAEGSSAKSAGKHHSSSWSWREGKATKTSQKREKDRRFAAAVSSTLQRMFFMPGRSAEEPVALDEVASIVGTGSLFVEDPDLQAATARIDSMSSEGGDKEEEEEEEEEDGPGLALQGHTATPPVSLVPTAGATPMSGFRSHRAEDRAMAPDAVPSGDWGPFTAAAPPPPPSLSPDLDLRRPPASHCATPRTGDPTEVVDDAGASNGLEGSKLLPPSRDAAFSSQPLSAPLFPAPRVRVPAAAAPQEEGGREGRGGRATNLSLQRTARIREGYRDWRALGAAHPLLRVRKPMLPPLPLPQLAAVESELRTPCDTSSVGYSTPLEEVSPVGGEQGTNQSPPPPPPPPPPSPV